jgi:hypothetical protein
LLAQARSAAADSIAEVNRDGPTLGLQIVPSGGRQRLAEPRQLGWSNADGKHLPADEADGD